MTSKFDSIIMQLCCCQNQNTDLLQCQQCGVQDHSHLYTQTKVPNRKHFLCLLCRLSILQPIIMLKKLQFLPLSINLENQSEKEFEFYAWKQEKSVLYFDITTYNIDEERLSELKLDIKLNNNQLNARQNFCFINKSFLSLQKLNTLSIKIIEKPKIPFQIFIFLLTYVQIKKQILFINLCERALEQNSIENIDDQLIEGFLQQNIYYVTKTSCQQFKFQDLEQIIKNDMKCQCQKHVLFFDELELKTSWMKKMMEYKKNRKNKSIKKSSKKKTQKQIETISISGSKISKEIDFLFNVHPKVPKISENYKEKFIFWKKQYDQYHLQDIEIDYKLLFQPLESKILKDTFSYINDSQSKLQIDSYRIDNFLDIFIYTILFLKRIQKDPQPLQKALIYMSKQQQQNKLIFNRNYLQYLIWILNLISYKKSNNKKILIYVFIQSLLAEVNFQMSLLGEPDNLILLKTSQSEIVNKIMETLEEFLNQILARKTVEDLIMLLRSEMRIYYCISLQCQINYFQIFEQKVISLYEQKWY